MTNLIARTGRVQSWIDDPNGRLPVSCTTFLVDNELDGPDGIQASWRFASRALRGGAGVAIHLSKLDPKGTERPSGVVASGQYHLAESILCLTKLSAEVENSATEQ